MAVTIRDVAAASGVHVSTVSRAFSAPHKVNQETRTRVLAVAEGLGYRPNRAARALTTGRTHNIGLIVADIANPFFPPLIKAAQAQARLDAIRARELARPTACTPTTIPRGSAARSRTRTSP